MKVPPELEAELAALAALPDSAIDTSDIPETTDWSGARRGIFSNREKAMDVNKPVVLKLWGSASTGPTEFDGQFLKRMDFTAFDGRGDLVLTPHLAEARQFAGMEEAWHFIRTVPFNCPRRPDGQPNRPLTAMNWQFESVEPGGNEEGKRP